MIYFELFITFFLIGLFTFGGGYAMIPMIKEIAVDKGWLTYEQLVDFIGISESTPGPFAVNIATFIGVEQGGVFGGICATLGVLFPSFIVILIVAIIFSNFINNFYVKSSLAGIKPIIIGLIAGVILTLFFNLVIKDGFDFIALFIIGLIFLLSRIKKVHPLFLIFVSAFLGIALYSL